MKFEESSLAEYLAKNLPPLTEADPVILSEYVVALLKKDKSTKELQNLCTDSLVEFLGQNTRSFTAKLFQALEDGSIVRADGNLDVVEKLEVSHPVMTLLETHQLKHSPKEKKRSSSSEPISDPEEKEVSDDDDRNHKHRRREARSDFPHNDVEEPPIRRTNRKRSKPYDTGQVFLESDPQMSGKEYNLTPEKNISLKMDKRHSVSGPLLRAPVDFGPRTRLGQPFRIDSGPRFDLSASVGRPSIGRGRGRSAVSWSQHDSRFSNPLDTLDYASRMASQGSGHPNLFVGAGFPSAASAQNTSWSGFGFIPGMGNGILDPIHPLGLNGTLPPTIAPPLNLGMPRQRCRDFEERGFCLRGDMCPMEHGLNRIVVEDVQSLSQFNLPVSVPSSNKLGVQAGSGAPTTVPAPSSVLTNNKGATSKISKSEVMDDAVKPNVVLSTSGGADADVYDPDQPLWNIDRPNTSTGLLMLPSSNIGDEALWDADDSARHCLRLSDGIESDITGRNATTTMGEKNKTSTAWGRIGSRFKSESESRSNCGMSSTGYCGNEVKERHEEAIGNSDASNLYARTSTTEIGSKATAIQSVPRPFADSGYRSHRPSSKASRTLYVYGIPQTDNKWNALLSHFKKFGKVVHIYVPPNSEKAFVQFTKREEAEAALKSPDAVMGNRFIKLSWANHDRVPVEMQSSAHTKSQESPSVVMSSVSSQQRVADVGKEIRPSSSQKRNRAANASTAETPISVSGHPKAQLTNVPVAAPSVPKKVENLELLDEIRKKQEILDKKRDEFRRQLEKIEKQAISVKKGEAVSEQAVLMHKVDVGSEATKRTDPKNLYCLQKCQDIQKTLEKRKPEEALVSPSSKANLATLQQSRKNISKINSSTVPLLNRFKLDNRSTSFRIIPPLPADFANVAVLKDHFSRFGVISSLVLEEPEAHTENADSKSSNNCSASISFANRHSAEKAYQAGKCWEGHNLQFKWLTVTPNTSSSIGTREASTLKLDQNAEVQAEPVTAASTPVNAVKPTSCLISEIVAGRNEEPNMVVESTSCASISLLESQLPTSQSSSTIPLDDNCTHESDTPRVEGSINVIS